MSPLDLLFFEDATDATGRAPPTSNLPSWRALGCLLPPPLPSQLLLHTLHTPGVAPVCAGVVARCAQHLAAAGADLSTRADTTRLQPHEEASAMGFKAAAAVLRAHVLEEAEVEHIRSLIEQQRP